MASYASGVVVRHSKPQLVVPAQQTPSEIKHLSDIDDQEGLRKQFCFTMFYKSSPTMKEADPAKVIKRAICLALVHYYPLAGRIIEGPNRKLMVDCSAEGVLFIKAEADISLEQLGDSIKPPCPYRKQFLYRVPGSEDILGCPLLLIQVTRLSCGGFVFAVRKNHVVCDSFGLVQFLNAVGKLARDPNTSIQQSVWQREIFSARHPRHVTCIHHEYEDFTDRNTSQTTDNYDTMVHASYFFGPKDILSLRKRLPHDIKKCSTFELLSACMWKCRTLALDVGPNEVVGVSCFITARGKVKVPDGYYGNAFVFPTALSEASLLCQKPLGYALDLIREAKARMNEEYIRSVTDLLVLKGRPMYRTTGNFLVADATRVGFEEVDFGWGKPIYGGPAEAIPFVSFLARFKNSRGEDGILAMMLLPRLVMKKFLLELMKMTTDDETLNNYPTDRMVIGARSML